MKTIKSGTEIQYYLISDDRFETDILSKINGLFINLIDGIEGKLTVKNIHTTTPRLIEWQDGSKQYKIYCTLVLLQPLKEEEIYCITNKIQSNPLKIVRKKIHIAYA